MPLTNLLLPSEVHRKAPIYGSCGDELSCNCPRSLLSQHLTLQPRASKEEVTRLPGWCWLSDLQPASGIALHVPSAVAPAHYTMLTGISTVTYAHLKGHREGRSKRVDPRNSHGSKSHVRYTWFFPTPRTEKGTKALM